LEEQAKKLKEKKLRVKEQETNRMKEWDKEIRSLQEQLNTKEETVQFFKRRVMRNFLIEGKHISFGKELGTTPFGKVKIPNSHSHSHSYSLCGDC
jgi:hypothetical protein